MNNKPWLSAPIPHQLAFKNANISQFQQQSTTTPFSNNLAAKYAQVDNQTNQNNAAKLNFHAPNNLNISPIHERNKPPPIRSAIHSSIVSPELSGNEGMTGPSNSSSSLSTMGSGGKGSLSSGPSSLSSLSLSSL